MMRFVIKLDNIQKNARYSDGFKCYALRLHFFDDIYIYDLLQIMTNYNILKWLM